MSKKFLGRYHPHMTVVLWLSFASGLPYNLAWSTLQTWYSDVGISIVTVGLLGLVTQPYLYKFLWAPLIDRYRLPWLTRRRGWIAACQLMISVLLIIMAHLDPRVSPLLLAFLALTLAFFSATQDIAIDAHRTDLLNSKERGKGAAFYTAGYRLGYWMGATPALIIAGLYGWKYAYLLMAFLMGLAFLKTLMSPEVAPPEHTPTTLRTAIVEPWKEFTARRGAVLMLCILFLYKLGDGFAASLVNPFLIDLGFSIEAIGLYNSTFMLLATLAGAAIGGLLLMKLSLMHALIFFGILQALANLSFMLLAVVGKNYSVMISAVIIENLAAGMGTAALMSLLMTLCHPSFSATQFALLSAVAAFGRISAGPIAGLIVAKLGWSTFYLLTAIIAIPGILLIYFAKDAIQSQLNWRRTLDGDQ